MNGPRPSRGRHRSDDRCLSQAERGRAVFDADPLVQVWMVHHLEILGEACRSMSAEVRAAHVEVRWAAILGMRNVLVHDYFGIDLGEVWSTVERDLRCCGQPLKW